MPTYLIKLDTSGEEKTFVGLPSELAEFPKVLSLGFGVKVGIERTVIEQWSREFAKERLGEAASIPTVEQDEMGLGVNEEAVHDDIQSVLAPVDSSEAV